MLQFRQIELSRGKMNELLCNTYTLEHVSPSNDIVPLKLNVSQTLKYCMQM